MNRKFNLVSAPNSRHFLTKRQTLRLSRIESTRLHERRATLRFFRGDTNHSFERRRRRTK